MKNLSKGQEIYDKFQVGSDCFCFQDLHVLEKTNVLIHGEDATSLLIAAEIKKFHAFYSNYKLGFNLCNKKASADEISGFASISKQLSLTGSGFLIAEREYYEAMEHKFKTKLGLITPTFLDDYIAKMVAHQFELGHYVEQQKMTNILRFSTVVGRRVYKRRDIGRFDVLIIRTDSLDSVVYASYLYQEIKLLYGISAAVLLLHKTDDVRDLDRCVKLAQDLFIPVENVIGTKQVISDINEEIIGFNVLFISPARHSALTSSRMKCWQKQTNSFNYGLYVFEEDFRQLCNNQEFNLDDILYDVNSAVRYTLPTPEDSEEICMQIQLIRDELHQTPGYAPVSHATYRDLKVEQLKKMHQSYLKMLFEL